MLKYLPWVAIAAIVLFGWSFHERRVGELNGRIASLVRESKRVDTLYRRDTLTLTRVRRITDTVEIPAPIRKLIADERQACDQVIQTCESRVAVRDSIIKVLKRKPSVLSHLPWILGGVVGGILLK
jgi:hypothetical protein